MSISSLPTPPARNQARDVFVANADAFLAALPTFATQANVLGVGVTASAATATTEAALAGTSAVNAAISAANAALSASVTGWISGHSYTSGTVVWSLVNFQSYRCSAAITGTTDPASDPTHWTLLNAGQPGGLTLTSPMSGNITLTLASTKHQNFSPSLANLNIFLPAANTLPTAGWSYSLKNIAKFPVCIFDNGGNIVGWVLPGSTVPIVCESIGTANGVWRVETGNRAIDNGFYKWGASVSTFTNAPFGTNSFIGMGAVGLDAELGVMLCGLTTVQAVAYRAKDTALQTGSVNSLGTAGGTSYDRDACANGAAEILVAFSTSSGSSTPIDLVSVVVNTSGLATTVASPVSGPSAIVNFVGLESIAASNNILTYTESSTGKAWIAIVSGTGSGISVASAVALGSTTSMKAAVSAALSSTLAHTIYSDNSTIYLNRVTISGTTPTPGTQTSISSRPNASASTVQIVKLTATTSLAVYSGVNSNGNANGGTVYANIITDTGSGITQNETVLSDDLDGGYSFGTQGSHKTNLIACYKGANSSINCLFSDGVSLKLASIRVIGGVAIMSALVEKKLAGPLVTVDTTGYSIAPRIMRSSVGAFVVPYPTWSGFSQTSLNWVAATASTTRAEATIVYEPFIIAPQA